MAHFFCISQDLLFELNIFSNGVSLKLTIVSAESEVPVALANTDHW